MQKTQTSNRDITSLDMSHQNILVAAANPLLNAIPQIRHSVSHSNPVHLRQQLIDQVRRFEQECQKQGLSYEVIVGARYCLCTALDEAAALTPWGRSSVWTSNGLLVTFHNETWGGEKFFQLLAKLSQNSQQHILLLELIYFCLMLGFEGRYRVLDNGRSQLETIKQRLLQMIKNVRGSYQVALSPHPVDQPVLRKLWRPAIPLWAGTAVMGLAACLFYIALNWRLGDYTSPVLAKIYQTVLPERPIHDTASPLPAMLNLKTFLKPEIDAGLVAVRDEADKSVVTLKGDGLFTSGSTDVRGRYESVIQRIASAMENVSGKILVIGYSDNVPIRSARFASNYELSLARAQSVQTRLQQQLSQPSRVKAEGRGESHPLVPNTSAENRALNRRVEITLLVAPVTTHGELNDQEKGN